MVSEGACAIVWTFYFVVINRNAFYFIYFTVFINILALFSCFYLTESPRYLFGMENSMNVDKHSLQLLIEMERQIIFHLYLKMKLFS